MSDETTPLTSSTAATNETDDERPFTKAEIVKFVIIILIFYPLGVGAVLLVGAYVRTFPDFPPLWFGFKWTVLTLPPLQLIPLFLLLDYPRVIRARMSKITAGPTESLEEQRFHQISTAVFFPGLVLMTYDAVERNTTSNSFPKLWNIIGTLSMLGALLWIVQVLRFNKFAARVVHVQAGQKLVTTGPYSVVRHPMYLGFGPAVFGFSLSVGSVWGLLPMGVCVLLIAHRTYGEERFLVETFGEAYQDYRTAVPYKMIPYVF